VIVAYLKEVQSEAKQQEEAEQQAVLAAKAATEVREDTSPASGSPSGSPMQPVRSKSPERGRTSSRGTLRGSVELPDDAGDMEQDVESILQELEGDGAGETNLDRGPRPNPNALGVKREGSFQPQSQKRDTKNLTALSQNPLMHQSIQVEQLLEELNLETKEGEDATFGDAYCSPAMQALGRSLSNVPLKKRDSFDRHLSPGNDNLTDSISYLVEEEMRKLK
jgi:hypothetical protein